MNSNINFYLKYSTYESRTETTRIGVNRSVLLPGRLGGVGGKSVPEAHGPYSPCKFLRQTKFYLMRLELLVDLRPVYFSI